MAKRKNKKNLEPTQEALNCLFISIDKIEEALTLLEDNQHPLLNYKDVYQKLKFAKEEINYVYDEIEEFSSPVEDEELVDADDF